MCAVLGWGGVGQEVGAGRLGLLGRALDASSLSPAGEPRVRCIIEGSGFSRFFDSPGVRSILHHNLTQHIKLKRVS